MGTHGRNAITKNGKHICYEQSLDGHYAADDLTLPFLRDGIVPNFSKPTMQDQTDECDHVFYSHIDYDKKILYTSWYSPEYWLNLVDEQLCLEWFGTDEVDTKEFKKVKDRFKLYKRNMEKLNKQGWTFEFDCTNCPIDSGCINI